MKEGFRAYQTLNKESHRVQSSQLKMARGKTGKILRRAHRKMARGEAHEVPNTSKTRGKRVTKKMNAERAKRGVTHEERLENIRIRMRCGEKIAPIDIAELSALGGRFDQKEVKTAVNGGASVLHKVFAEQSAKEETQKILARGLAIAKLLVLESEDLLANAHLK